MDSVVNGQVDMQVKYPEIRIRVTKGHTDHEKQMAKVVNKSKSKSLNRVRVMRGIAMRVEIKYVQD